MSRKTTSRLKPRPSARRSGEAKFLYLNNHRFVADRSLPLPYLNEVMRNIRDQIAPARQRIITISFIAVSALAASLCTIITLIPKLIPKNITLFGVLLPAMLLAGALYGVVVLRWACVYVYGFLKYSRSDPTGEKTYNWLRTHGRISKGRITTVFKSDSNISIYYTYNRSGIPIYKSYTTRVDSSVKENDRVVILHNAVVSILL